ncbi:cupin domain-containing protein [Vibrio hannami]|uniref:cupin domain-containing protein n=1 Tax=Vibrio hannami TaxID=2717094 RepID=UPI00240F7F00|nr:cupin domain-containing protein [Vibrio hannami]MDG3087834.1 cupin domain-containing protein [Vibrio hannami]
MNLRMDFQVRVAVDTEQQEWTPSPLAGVWRKPLEREAAESGHTTSIVRYDPNSKFSSHLHPLGEEIFVLDGVFSDETGDFPSGTYIRNPPGSRHAPFSNAGCTIFVKLNQFNELDLEQKRITTTELEWLPGNGNLQVMPLHNYEGEHVALVKWPRGEKFQSHAHFGGEEILVLSGELKDEYGSYPVGTWLRSPHMSRHLPYVDDETIILVKTGHLPI